MGWFESNFLRLIWGRDPFFSFFSFVNWGTRSKCKKTINVDYMSLINHDFVLCHHSQSKGAMVVDKVLIYVFNTSKMKMGEVMTCDLIGHEDGRCYIQVLRDLKKKCMHDILLNWQPHILFISRDIK